MKLFFLFLFTSILFLNCSCKKFPPRVYSIHVKNNTDHSIYSFVASRGAEFIYPDTTLPTEKKFFQKTSPDMTAYYYTYIKWEEEFEELPADTLSIYIFHADTLEKYDWQTVRNEYKILHRYDLSLQDLERLNYTVTYP